MNEYDKIKAIIVDKLGVDPDEVRNEAKLVEDLGATVLSFSEIITALQTEFGIIIPGEEAEKFDTIMTIYEYIMFVKKPAIQLDDVVVIYPEAGQPDRDHVQNPYPWSWPNTYKWGDPNYYTNPNYYPAINNINSRDKKIAAGLVWALDKVAAKVPYKQQYGDLRTANTSEALAYMDCSEMVCRYLKEIGLTTSVVSRNCWALKSYVLTSAFTEVSTPQPGDIFLWNKTPGNGHTGIVRSYDPSTGMVTYLHETSWGDVHHAVQGTAHIDRGVFKSHRGWTGFFRPNVN